MGGRGGGGKGRSGNWHGGGTGKGGSGRGSAIAGNGAPWDDGVQGVLHLLQQQSQHQQQLLQALCSGGAGPAGGGGGGGGGQRRYNGGGSGAAQARDGDWQCSRCHFAANFARRQRCFECGAPRAVHGTRGTGLSAGPVGAGGLRPQLAWGSERTGRTLDEAPTHRVPGASLAAVPRPAAAAATTGGTRGETTRVSAVATAPAADGGGKGGSKWATAGAGNADQPLVDEEGFQQVGGRTARKSRGAAAAHSDSQQRSPAAVASAEPRGCASWVPNAAGAGQSTAGEADAGEDGADAHQDHAADDDDDPATLRQKLDEEEATVKVLTRGGMSAEHPAMRAAVAARDAALQAWRSARTPHPVARRMGWAQRRLDKALHQQDRLRDELHKFDQETRERRDKIIARFDLAKDRVRRQRDELEALQEEASAELHSTRRPGGGLFAKLAGGMRNTVAPNVAALAESLPAGSEASKHVAQLMAHLEGMQHELEQRASEEGQEGGYEEYDIADGGYADGRSDDDYVWSESHELDDAHGDDLMEDVGSGDADGTRRWQPKGYGRWNKAGPHNRREDGTGKGGSLHSATAAAAAVTAAAVTATAAPPAHPATDTGPTPRGAGSSGGAHIDTPPRAAATPPSASEEERPHKHRKGQAAEDTLEAKNAAMATGLLLEQKAAEAAGAWGSEAAVQAAGQLHAKHVNQVVAAAIAQNVQPLTDAGEELIMLGPQELAAWAEKYLTGQA